MSTWSSDAVFYHIYPIGLLDAPLTNDVNAAVVSRLPGLSHWIPHLRDLGCNALYLGPLFESGTHGYDTIDYRKVDRRLGTNEDLEALVSDLHQNGIRVILDGVFNHVSWEFPQFLDLRERGEASPYRDWFHNIQFGKQSPRGDAFTYEAWAGNFELVKLNLQNPEVRDYLFTTVRGWFAEFEIDGLRLDAADVIDKDFLRDLAATCRAANPDCWIIGEIVHGDYRDWANPEMLDSATNYECFKGLYSSLNDRNFFEIAHSLTRQFGPEGIYRDLLLYSFADNHDVDRVASLLRDDRDLFPLYALLFTIPGTPSLYYGSEWGYRGKKKAETMVRCALHSRGRCLKRSRNTRSSSHGLLASLPFITRHRHCKREDTRRSTSPGRSSHFCAGVRSSWPSSSSMPRTKPLHCGWASRSPAALC